MPVKDQTLCYRTIKGERWPNLFDVMEVSQEQEITNRRKAGQRLAIRKHKDGFKQAFIHPEDLDQPF